MGGIGRMGGACGAGRGGMGREPGAPNCAGRDSGGGGAAGSFSMGSNDGRSGGGETDAVAAGSRPGFTSREGAPCPFLDGHAWRLTLPGARRRRLATLDAHGLHAHDLPFDQQVIRPADHDQMLDIVAAHQHELAMAVEIESVDDSEARLACATWRRRTNAAAKGAPDINDDEAEKAESNDHGQNAAHPPVAEQIIEHEVSDPSSLAPCEHSAILNTN
jgi:hypothetical protein